MIESLKKAIYVLIPLVVYVVVHDIVRILLMFVLQLTANILPGVYDVFLNHSALISGIISGLDMIIGALAVRILIKFDIEELALDDYFNLNGLSFYRKDKLHRPWVSWCLIVFAGISAALALNTILCLTGITGASASYTETSTAQYALPVWLGVIIYGFVSPAVEEFVFRLAIFGRMKRKFSFGIAVIVSSLFFGLYHQNLVQGIYGTIMGIIMCLACEYVHSLLGAFAVHSVANLTVYLLGVCGVLSGLNNSIVCVILSLSAIAVLTLGVAWTVKSYKMYGIPEGVTFVGCFYIDTHGEE